MAGSIVGQVSAALGSLKAKPGESRLVDKQKGDGSHLQKLYGHKTYTRYRDSLVPFAKWARDEYGVRLLVQIPKDAAARYVAEQNWTPGSIKTFVSALGKLEAGIEARFGRKADFGREAIKTGTRSLEARTHIRPFSPEDARAITAWVDQRAERLGNAAPAIGLHLAFGAGLRASEVVSLKVGQVDFRNGRIVDVEGKGGRVRTIGDLPKSLLDRLKVACQGKQPGDRVVECSKRTMERWVSEAKGSLRIAEGNGVHGLRGAFARERLSDYMGRRGWSFDKAVGQISRDLGHSRLSVIRHYL